MMHVMHPLHDHVQSSNLIDPYRLVHPDRNRTDSVRRSTQILVHKTHRFHGTCHVVVSLSLLCQPGFLNQLLTVHHCCAKRKSRFCAATGDFRLLECMWSAMQYRSADTRMRSLSFWPPQLLSVRVPTVRPAPQYAFFALRH